MKKQYIKPIIAVIPQRYSEGLMDSQSMGIGTGTIGTALSKPGDEWGNTWTETEQPKASGDDWGM